MFRLKEDRRKMAPRMHLLADPTPEGAMIPTCGERASHRCTNRQKPTKLMTVTMVKAVFPGPSLIIAAPVEVPMPCL